MKHLDFRSRLLMFTLKFLPSSVRWQEEVCSVLVTVPVTPPIDTVISGKLRTCKYTGKIMRKLAGGVWKLTTNEEALAIRNGKISLVRVGDENAEEYAEPDIMRNFEDED